MSGDRFGGLVLGLIAPLVLATYALVVALDGSSATLAAWALTVGLGSLLYANWRASGQGRNGSFLFLATCTLFLAGRAISVVVEPSSVAIDVIGFGREYPVSVTTLNAFVFYVLSSATLVHVGSLLPSPRLRHYASNPGRVAFYRFVFLASLPLYLYKNIYYFTYLMSEGGYLAIYQGREHVEAVGFLPRLASVFFIAAFTLYFFSERDQKALRRWFIVFALAFATELLVGLRGKFLTTLLTFVLFYKIRFGGTFSARQIAALVACIVALSTVVAGMREQKTSEPGQASVLAAFINQQGVSAGVFESILQFPTPFYGKGTGYLLKQSLAPFIPQSEARPGEFLADDLSEFLMPEAYALGFGTGSSYLAELYLLGGGIAIGVASLAIGCVLTILSSKASGFAGAVSFWMTAGFIYYPRTMLQEPVHNLIRYGLPMLALAFAAALLFPFSSLRAPNPEHAA